MKNKYKIKILEAQVSNLNLEVEYLQDQLDTLTRLVKGGNTLQTLQTNKAFFDCLKILAIECLMPYDERNEEIDQQREEVEKLLKEVPEYVKEFFNKD